MRWRILSFGLLGLVALVVASFLTTRTFHVEKFIAAPPEVVWSVLMDTKRYPEWNPVFIEVDGEFVVGARVLNKFRNPSGEIIETVSTVRAMVPNRELRQTGGIQGVITFDHRWMLEPVDGGTRVVQHELDRGAFLWFWNSDWIEPAYSSVNDALSERVKSLAE